MNLIIVESPSKAKTIEKYIKGQEIYKDKFSVLASVGHIRDLPKSNKKAIDISGGFIPYYEISPNKEKIVHELKNAARKSDKIFLATDPDREGEAIAWHIQEILNEDKKIKASIKRISFHEVTKDAVLDALKNPREIDTDLRKAQEARRVLDRLVGYDLSGLIWKKVRYGLSAGRVQSPALRIIMEREREIRAFIPKKFWKIFGVFETIRNEEITLECSEDIWEEKFAEKIIWLAKNSSWYIKDLKESKQKRSPYAPFTTSTLQQVASSRLGYSPSKTMQIAQKLYEAGHITYMRTDSTNLSPSSQSEMINLIKKEYGEEFAQNRIYKTKSKNAQEAHEAIRPTNVNLKPADCANNKGACKGTWQIWKPLYQLIWERAVSSQMSDALFLKTKIVANIEKMETRSLASVEAPYEIPDFIKNGSRLLFKGWLAVNKTAKSEDVELPEIKIGENLKLLNLNSEEKFTTPPNRYTEAGLIKELENRGIGRPSTYASIMRTLEERKYVSKENRTLFPTEVGEVVSNFLENNFSKYISDSFTAEIENELDEISRGKKEYEKVLKNFYDPFSKEVKSKEKLEKATNLGDAPENMKCPKCGNSMIIKLSKVGKFYSCAKYPDCVGALKLDGSLLDELKETGEICDECGNKFGGKLVTRQCRDGSGGFISCSRYPKCKYIKKDEAEEARKKTGVMCLNCKEGEMMERKGRFGIFYSCNKYPNCKFAMKAKPTGKICSLCSSLMMEGTKTIPERCSNKSCPNYNPKKK